MGKLGSKLAVTALTGAMLVGIEVAWRALGVERRIRRALGF